jgi:hypothetical protein
MYRQIQFKAHPLDKASIAVKIITHKILQIKQIRKIKNLKTLFKRISKIFKCKKRIIVFMKIVK